MSEPPISKHDGNQPNSNERWKMVREIVVHEDNLSNQRLTWLFNSQTLLFAAFAVIFQGTVKQDIAPESIATTKAVLSVISLVGILSCAIISMSIEVGIRHLDSITKQWKKHNDDWNPLPPIRGLITGRRYSILHSRFLPLAFIGSWGTLLLIIVSPLINPQAIFWTLVGGLAAYAFTWVFASEGK